MLKYFAAVGDPYNFCVGKMRVRVTFGSSRAPSVQSGLEKNFHEETMTASIALFSGACYTQGVLKRRVRPAVGE